MKLISRSGRNVTGEYPQLQGLADSLLHYHVVVDGEAVVVDNQGIPNFNAMQNNRRGKVELWAFDLLYLEHRSLAKVPYRDRRKLLDMLASISGLKVPGLIHGDGAEAFEYSRQQNWEGIVAKRLNSTYQPGRRSPDWIKNKNWNTQEVVIGGWKEGEGRRSGGIGSLLMGIPGEGGLIFAGKVGTGFTDRDLDNLYEKLHPLSTKNSPFDSSLPRNEKKNVTFIEPVLVGEVRYMDWTGQTMRQPSWRGIRKDKNPEEVVIESGATR